MVNLEDTLDYLDHNILFLFFLYPLVFVVL